MTQIRQQLLDLFPTLESQRLILRKIDPDDTAEMFRCITDQRVQRHASFQPDMIRFPARMFRYFEESYRNLRDVHFAIALKQDQDQQNRWVGLCSLQYWDEATRKARLGYVLSPDYWNQGLATEAVKSLLSFGFEKMNLQVVEARCEQDNPASERVLQKCGMSSLGGTGRDRLQKTYSISHL